MGVVCGYELRSGPGLGALHTANVHMFHAIAVIRTAWEQQEGTNKCEKWGIGASYNLLTGAIHISGHFPLLRFPPLTWMCIL